MTIATKKVEAWLTEDEYKRFESVRETLGLSAYRYIMKMVELAEAQIEKCEVGEK